MRDQLRYRPLLWLSFCMAVGAGLGQGEALFFPVQVPAVLLLLSLLWVIVMCLRGRLRWIPRTASETVCLGPSGGSKGVSLWFLPVAGLAVCSLMFLAVRGQESKQRWSRQAYRGRAPAVLEVCTPAEERIEAKADPAGVLRGRWHCTARLCSYRGKPVEGVYVRLAGSGRLDFARGDRLHGTAMTEPLRPPAFPGDFDLTQYLATRGLSLSLRLLKNDGDGYVIERSDAWSIRRLLDTVRAGAIRNLLQRAPACEARILALAMFGYRFTPQGRQGMSLRAVKETFRRIGIGHVLAISGLHVGLITCFVWWVLGLFCSDRRWMAAISMVAVLLYLGMSGGRVAALRAGMMALLYLSGFLVGRRTDFLNTLGLAACLLLAWNPMTITDLGFQLSFVAVIFISRISQECDGLRMGWGLQVGERKAVSWSIRWRRYLLDAVVLSLAAWLGVWPLVAFVFHQLNPIGLLVNLLVMPLMMLVLAGGILFQVLALLQVPAAFSAWPTFFVTILIRISELAEYVPGGSIALARPSGFFVAVYYLAWAVFMCRRCFPAVRRPLGAVAGVSASVAALLLVWSCAVGQPVAGVRFSICPQSQSEAILIEQPDRPPVLVGRLVGQGSAVARYIRSLGYDRVQRLEQLTGRARGEPPFRLRMLVDVDRFEEQPLRKEGEQPSLGWHALTDQVELATSYDRDGALVWWAVRCRNECVGVSEWCWQRQIDYRFRRRFPGTEAGCVMLRVRGAEAEQETAEKCRDTAAVFLNHDLPATASAQWHSRRTYGIVRLEIDSDGQKRLDGFDGRGWRRLGP